MRRIISIFSALMLVFLGVGFAGEADCTQVSEKPGNAGQKAGECGAAEAGAKECGDKAEIEKENQYYALFVDGRKIGYGEHIRTVADGRVTTTEKMSMTISRAGMQMQVSTTETHIETPSGEPIGFVSLQRMNGMDQSSRGLYEDGVFKVTTTNMGGTREQEMKYPEGAVMSEGLRLKQLEVGLEQGASGSAEVFSPELRGTMRTSWTVGPKEETDLLGRHIELYRIVSVLNTPMGSLRTTTWVDDELDAMKMEIPMMGMNLEMVACDKTFAMSENDVVDFFSKMAVDSPVRLSGDVLEDGLVYYLKPANGASLNIPETDFQSVSISSEGLVQVTVVPTEPEGGDFPYEGNDPELLAALEPGRYLESDDAGVIALARKAIWGAENAGEAAVQIKDFVREYIDSKNLSVGYASAAEVADSKQGDCSEHAVLTAAMCRAVGIPANVACGVVYAEQFAGSSDVFGGHAWTQVWVDGKWSGLDATSREFGAGHITLAVGDGEPADFLGLVNTLGNFTIDKIEAIEQAGAVASGD
jgi:hypothetical protein